MMTATASTCGTITGNTTLNSDVSAGLGNSCFTIAANNVILNCNGYSIIGDTSTIADAGTSGIYTNRNGTTIKNCVITGFQYGIYTSTNLNLTVRNTTIHDTMMASQCCNMLYSPGDPIYGVYLESTANALLTNMTISNLTGGQSDIDDLWSGITSGDAYGITSAASDTGISNITISGVNIVGVRGGTGADDDPMAGTCGTPGGNTFGIHLYAATTNWSITNVNITGNSGGQGGDDPNFVCGGNGGFFRGISADIYPDFGIPVNTVGTYISVANVNIINNTGGKEGGTNFVGVAGDLIGINAQSLSGMAITNTVVNNSWQFGFSYAAALSIAASLTSSISNSVFEMDTSGSGIYLTGQGRYTVFTTGDFNTFTNVTSIGASPSVLISQARKNTFINCTVITTGTSGIGVYLAASSNNVFGGCSISGNQSTYGALAMSNSSDTIVANSTINGMGGARAASIQTQMSKDNIIYNNTFANATNLFYLDAKASNTLFYWNNFTSASGYYITDLNGTNKYNTTVNGQKEGNIWFNSANLNGTNNSTGFPSYKVATGGSGYPYNNSTSGGKFICSFNGCGDYAPLFYVAPAAANSCTYSGSGNWIIQLSDYCNITTSTSCGTNNLTFNGTGYATFGNASLSPLIISANKFIWGGINNAYLWFKSAVWFNGTMGG